MNGSVAAIILAAGASSRLGRPKQLLTQGGETLLERAIRMAVEVGAAPVLVVLGAYHARIRDAVTMENAFPVINQQWEQGISTSIHAGLDALKELDPDAEGALILACDQPRLTVEHLRSLFMGFATQDRPSIVASAYADVLGIPAVFPVLTFENLLALRGDKGARALLADPPCALIAVPFLGGELDIDRPEDLAQLE